MILIDKIIIIVVVLVTLRKEKRESRTRLACLATLQLISTHASLTYMYCFVPVVFSLARSLDSWYVGRLRALTEWLVVRGSRFVVRGVVGFWFM